MIEKTPGPLTKIEQWISQNFKGKLLAEIPKDYNRREEIYWKIGNYRYGPIKWKEIPIEIRNII